MDYRHPLSAILPGVTGRVLDALTRTGSIELTQRELAAEAGVSPSAAGPVIHRLAELGIISRREVGSAALVRPVAENDAARAILELSKLRDTSLIRLREHARSIRPKPASLLIFGSFARGEADAESDLDVLVVRSRQVADDDGGWTDALGAWARQARRVTGNTVELLEIGERELGELLSRPGSVWQAISEEGIVLVGCPLGELVPA